jgi:hypothetical protein
VFFWLKTLSSLTICLMFDGPRGLGPSFITSLKSLWNLLVTINTKEKRTEKPFFLYGII